MFTPVVLDARNPGTMTGEGNQTYLVVSDGDAVLIDAGVGHPAHLDALALALRNSGAILTMVAVTHGHADHLAGAPEIAKAHPWATFAKWRATGDADSSVEWRSLGDEETLVIGSERLITVHTPGHSPDHVVFWHEATATVFTGDLVIAGGSVVIDVTRGGNLVQYLQSLERLRELEPMRLLPAHGPRVDDPGALIRDYIAHRLTRERQVVNALAAGHRTVEAIAESIYHGLDARLLPAAYENVRAHLEKLRAEDIAADSDGWRLL